MEHTIANITYDFTLSRDFEYIRRTGDYDMVEATCDDWDFEFHSICGTDGIEYPDDWEVPANIKNQLIAYWKDNYDPSPID